MRQLSWSHSCRMWEYFPLYPLNMCFLNYFVFANSVIKQINQDTVLKWYQPLSEDDAPPSWSPEPSAPPALPAVPPAPLLPGFGGGTGAPPGFKPTKCSCPESLLRKCPPTLIICPLICPPREGTSFWRLSWNTSRISLPCWISAGWRTSVCNLPGIQMQTYSQVSI